MTTLSKLKHAFAGDDLSLDRAPLPPLQFEQRVPYKYGTTKAQWTEPMSSGWLPEDKERLLNVGLLWLVALVIAVICIAFNISF